MDPLEQELLFQKYLEENPDLVKNQKISVFFSTPVHNKSQLYDSCVQFRL